MFRLRFFSCRISKSFLEKEARRLEEWLSNDFNGKMSYMENHFDKRTDPGKLVDGAKSVISVLFNYHNPKKQLIMMHQKFLNMLMEKTITLSLKIN